MVMDEYNKSRYTNLSLIKGLIILEQFCTAKTPLGISELSRMTGLHKSTVHRLVATLEECDWLRRTDTDKFKIAIKPIVLGRQAGEQMASLNVAHTFIRELRDQLQETVVLSMLVDGEVVCIDKATAHRSLACSSEIGKVYPCYAGATGFSVLLGMNESEAYTFLQNQERRKFTDKTVTDLDTLMKMYRKGRTDGYVIISGHKDIGITGTAMPLWFPAEQAYGSVGVLTPDFRYTEDVRQKTIAALQETLEKLRVVLAPGLSET